jgi:hypothetical protein
MEGCWKRVGWEEVKDCGVRGYGVNGIVVQIKFCLFFI